MLMLDLVDGSCFRPGDAIEGVVTWVCRGAPVGGAIKLRWTTRGKGSDDHELVVNLELASLRRPGESSLDALAAEDAREFSITAPEGPYSFSGALISLTWTLRATLRPDDEEAELELTISPTGKELRLGEAAG